MSLARSVFLCCLLMLVAVGGRSRAQEISSGPVDRQDEPPVPPDWPSIPLFSHFDLTLEPGQRLEAPGPFFYEERSDFRKIWAVPPVLSYATDSSVKLVEFDFLYPVMTYDRYGDQYRWQFFQLLSFAGGPTQTENVRKRFTLYPIYFQQRSSNPAENYTAYGPFYGHLKNRFMRDEIFYVMFPFYSRTRKKDVVTDNYVYPIFHLRHGNGLRGWQFWPLLGHEQKGLTYSTNGFGDVQRIPAHDRRFALWPLYFNDKNELGSPRVQWTAGLFPFYNFSRSEPRDSTTVLWPFFSIIDDRERKYREWELPWPVIVFARGEGKTTTRVLPFYSHAHNESQSSDSYLWPVLRHTRLKSAPLDRERTQILFFLYSNLVEKNTETGTSRRRVDLLPLFTYRKHFNGNTRLQVFAPLEPILPGAHKLDRDYSPVWSVWRSERNAKTGATSQSLLWNLYRHEKSAAAKKTSLLFGLFQYQSDSAGKRVRLFYIPPEKPKASGPAAATNAVPKTAQ